MTILRSATDPRWIEVALSDLDATLADHAHCEKKAVATAVKLVADHPGRPGLVRALARLAQEELQHFLAMITEVERRGRALPPDQGDPYVQQLLKLVRGGAPRLLDQLLVGAFIEARSCERFAALAPRLDAELADFYRSLLRSEARHFQHYLDLARDYGGDIDARIAAFAARERELIEAPDTEFRFHSGPPAGA